MSRRLGYGDLEPGAVIEIYVCDMQLGWQWEKREVVSIDIGRELIVKFRDPSDGRVYDIDVRAPRQRDRQMRRWEPLGYCSCGSPLTLHFYPRPGPAPGNMKVCTRDECDSSLAGIKRGMDAQMEKWREKGLLDQSPNQRRSEP